MMKFFPVILLLAATALYTGCSQPAQPAAKPAAAKEIITGADQTDQYVPYLRGKRVAVLANQTTIIRDKHLVDTLPALGVNIVKVFGPEHGFRGNVGAGVEIADEKDPATGIPIVSLYGPKRKPTRADLADVDVMIFDVQDVGVRFYTKINTLAAIMEACAENDKELLILDRPNPNGYLIDGPTLDMKHKSGIGMFPIPIAHGMTIAEFAQMINGERWLPNNLQCRLRIVRIANYHHDLPYTVPVKPSPNLNTQQAILLYPSTCLFEGTALNHGRGTMFPFTVFGAPSLKGKYEFSYTPVSIKGMSDTPLHMNQVCYGIDLRSYDTAELRRTRRINLEWLIELYRAFPEKEKFFDRRQSREIVNIYSLIGVSEFTEQIAAGKTADEIRATWEPGLTAFKRMRLKYLLYP